MAVAKKSSTNATNPKAITTICNFAKVQIVLFNISKLPVRQRTISVSAY